jgi:hypothetical protein
MIVLQSQILEGFVGCRNPLQGLNVLEIRMVCHMDKGEKKLNIYEPAAYCIRVMGEVGESWSEYFTDMDICTEYLPERQPVSTIKGRPRDQAELICMISLLYEMRLPLLLVEYIDEGSERR